MTSVQLEPGDLGQQVPELVREAAVVALVPATELRGWAAEMAWSVARAAASGGRRTALIDAFVNSPTLHAVAGASNDEGLVDVFEYGVSMNRIAQQQSQANLYFIPSGTPTAEPEAVMANPRWRRLSAGFRHEEALLLLYVAAEHLGDLAAEPDGMIVLAPQGLDTAARDVPAVMEAMGRGMPLLAVVAESGLPGSAPHAPASEEEAAPAGGGPAPLALLVQRPRKPWAAYVVVAGVAGVAGLGAAGWAFRDRVPFLQAMVAALGRPAGTDSTASAAPATTTATPAAAPTAAPPAPANRVAPLPWAVQLSTVGSLEIALAGADSLEHGGLTAMIAPLPLPGRRTQYRLYAGPFSDSTRADSALRALRAAGWLARSSGRVASVPLSVALSGGHTREAALAERARLRRAGVPAFVLGEASGTFRLYAGAFGAAVQPAHLQELLTQTGAGALGPRVGAVR